MKPAKFAALLLALLVGLFAFPISATAKCPDAPSDLVCAQLRYAFAPAKPAAGDEVTVVADWVDQRTAEPVTNEAWLARRGKPAYLWLWDHEPSELESIAYVEGVQGADLPRMVVPLQWDAGRREYQGTFVLPEAGRWHFRLGTVVPDSLSALLEADTDYVGPIQSLATSATTGALFERLRGSSLLAVLLGSGLVIWALRWLGQRAQKRRTSRLHLQQPMFGEE